MPADFLTIEEPGSDCGYFDRNAEAANNYLSLLASRYAWHRSLMRFDGFIKNKQTLEAGHSLLEIRPPAAKFAS